MSEYKMDDFPLDYGDVIKTEEDKRKFQRMKYLWDNDLNNEDHRLCLPAQEEFTRLHNELMPTAKFVNQARPDLN